METPNMITTEHTLGTGAMVRRCLIENPNFETFKTTGCWSSGCFPYKEEINITSLEPSKKKKTQKKERKDKTWIIKERIKKGNYQGNRVTQ